MAQNTPQTRVTVDKTPLPKVRADLLVLGIYKDTKKLPPALTAVDKAAGQAVSNLLKTGDFTGKADETALLYPLGKFGCRRIMLVGLGDKKSLQINTLRQAAGTAVRAADKIGIARLALALHTLIEKKHDPRLVGQALTEGMIIGRYAYQDYLSEKNDNSKKIKKLSATIIEPKAADALKINAGRKTGIILGQAQNRARSIANKPGNEINPPTLARTARRLAHQFSLRCKVLDEKQLEKLKMNAILAVGSGSVSKPRLIILEYQGRPHPKKSSPPDAVIVGKAITFDSGGISIKPSQKMAAMKFDKSGGCNVLAILTGLAQLKLPLKVLGLIPAAENLPSHTSYRPGDIIRTFCGKTVEIDNTDAEGRLILCDALTYAAQSKPRVILDMATLTGACVVALGEHMAGLFGNNSPLQRKLEKAARISGEKVWLMPSGKEYLDQMKSSIADLKNVGGREGSACSAAAFLGEFVKDTAWAHLDIAGVADTDKEKPFRSAGATGYGVRLLLEYLRSLKIS
ncbi:MAG: hypothetical protein AMJ79_11780 [Phycisphaerae bacterium SM23_30]|nr:MAG: hypothetical protein AMJ79_11780 [Phycisphaerae bacterium SM23_30]